MENWGDVVVVESVGSGRDFCGNIIDGEIEDESKWGLIVIVCFMGLEFLLDVGVY